MCSLFLGDDDPGTLLLVLCAGCAADYTDISLVFQWLTQGDGLIEVCLREPLLLQFEHGDCLSHFTLRVLQASHCVAILAQMSPGKLLISNQCTVCEIWTEYPTQSGREMGKTYSSLSARRLAILLALHDFRTTDATGSRDGAYMYSHCDDAEQAKRKMCLTQTSFSRSASARPEVKCMPSPLVVVAFTRFQTSRLSVTNAKCDSHRQA